MAQLPKDMELHYLILQYTTDDDHAIPMEVFEPLPADRVSIVRRAGLLGENLHHSAMPDVVCRFDYVFMMLDDVELTGAVSWGELLRLLGTTAAILSPCLRDKYTTSWDYMLHDPRVVEPTLILRDKCEFFVYFMTADTYRTYYAYIDPANPFLWGMDFILKTNMGLQPAILNHWVIRHHYRGTSAASQKAEAQAIQYLQRHGVSYADAHRASPGEKRIHLV